MLLKGIKVVELGQVYAGPYAGSIFADLGADVTKIERPGGGDDARRMGIPFKGGDAFVFHVFNRGKKSVTLDLNSPSDLAYFHQAISTSDIFIHNLRPDVVDKLGVSSSALCELNPQLIYCAISAFGHVGPMAQMPGYEPLMQAFSGLSSVNGGPDDPPMRSAVSLCDLGSGMWVVIGALAMLHRRRETGKGGVLTTSLLETALMWNAQKSDSYVNEGTLPERSRSGHPGFVPYEAFDTADNPILICCGNDRLFGKLAIELGHEEWITLPEFATNRARLTNKSQLMAVLVPIIQSQPRDEWIDRFQAAGIPCAPINTISEALTHAQVTALEQCITVPNTDVKLTALPLTIDSKRPRPSALAPAFIDK